ncbi:MAG: hypothetical protein AB4352_27305 [Hormoscilla sp.]
MVCSLKNEGAIAPQGAIAPRKNFLVLSQLLNITERLPLRH